jgi:hypothetical protein
MEGMEVGGEVPPTTMPSSPPPLTSSTTPPEGAWSMTSVEDDDVTQVWSRHHQHQLMTSVMTASAPTLPSRLPLDYLKYVTTTFEDRQVGKTPKLQPSTPHRCGHHQLHR